jgi:hypothetical protein
MADRMVKTYKDRTYLYEREVPLQTLPAAAGKLEVLTTFPSGTWIYEVRAKVYTDVSGVENVWSIPSAGVPLADDAIAFNYTTYDNGAGTLEVELIVEVLKDKSILRGTAYVVFGNPPL